METSSCKFPSNKASQAKIVRDPNKDAKLKEMLQATSLQQPIDFGDFNYKEYLAEQRLKDYENLA